MSMGKATTKKCLWANQIYGALPQIFQKVKTLEGTYV